MPIEEFNKLLESDENKRIKNKSIAEKKHYIDIEQFSIQYSKIIQKCINC